MPGASDERVRAFCAIDLTPDFRRALVATVARIRERAASSASASVRWVRAENLHLTLRFLSDIGPPEVEAVLAALRMRVCVELAFTLQLDSLAWFPSTSRPRAMAAIPSPSQPLERLAEAVALAVRDAGLSAEPRPFRAHVTAGRVRGKAPKGADRRALLELVELFEGDGDIHSELRRAVMSVREVVVFRSELKPTGAVYTPVGRVGLAEV